MGNGASVYAPEIVHLKNDREETKTEERITFLPGNSRNSTTMVSPTHQWLWVQSIAIFPHCCSECEWWIKDEYEGQFHVDHYHDGCIDGISVWKLCYLEFHNIEYFSVYPQNDCDGIDFEV